MSVSSGEIPVHQVATVLCLLLALVAPAWAQDAERPLGWHDQADLSYVATSGNASSTTLGLNNKLEHLWQGATFKLTTSALRAESTDRTRVAVGTPDAYRVDESSNRRLTAEKYALRARYDRHLGAELVWFVGTGWERNELAGVANRYQAIAGLGSVWWENERSHFKTDYGVTSTEQQDVVDAGDGTGTFLGAQLGIDFRQQIGERAELTLDLAIDENLDTTADLRADLTNALSVSMNEHLALKVSYQLLFDNRPALEVIPLQGASALPGATVRVPLERLDAIFNAALVVRFS